MHMLLFISIAFADTYIIERSPGQPLPLQALWSIPYFTETGWVVFTGQGSGFYVSQLSPGDWSMSGERTLGTGEMKDHSVARCPDRTWQHLASLEPPSSNALFYYDPGFTPIGQADIDATSVPRATNDGISICTVAHRALGFAERKGTRDFLYLIDEDGVVDPVPIELPESPRLTGAGSTTDRCDDQLLHISGFDAGPELVISTYDPTWALDSRRTVAPPNDGNRYYWPTGFISVEGGYLVALMGRGRDEPWDLDEGNLYVWVLDEDFALVEHHQLTFFSPQSHGAMRPWLEREDTLAIAGVDKDNHPVLVGLQLDLEAMSTLGESCPDPVSTTEPDNPDATDSGGDNPVASPGPSSCGAGRASAPALGLLAALALWRRRQRR